MAQCVNYIEQSPKIFKKFVEFLNATEESAIEENVRDVVAHCACRFPPVESCRRHLLSIGNSRDFPAVTLPALIGIALTARAWRTRPLSASHV
jgi:gamma-glutamylcysteine synthetase